jgi:hypothetical protein
MNRSTAIGCLVVLVALAVWVFVDALNPFNDRAFDRRAWSQGPDARIPMAKDVIRRVIQPGMTRDEVTRILGNADELITDHDAGGNVMPGRETLLYYLGSSSETSWLGLDDTFVYVHLNDNGVVIHTQVSGY